MAVQPGYSYSSIHTKEPLPLSIRVAHAHTMQADPKTDIYAAQKHGYVWSATMGYRQIQCSKFKRARVMISFNWVTSYDQGGLVIAFPSPQNPTPDSRNATTKNTHPLWVKAGIEINNYKPWASVVARETWADWSLSAPPEGVVLEARRVSAMVELERRGDALLVWVSGPNGEGRSMVRKVQWVFLDGRGEGDALIGVYCCAPDPDGERRKPLDVTFNYLDVLES